LVCYYPKPMCIVNAETQIFLVYNDEDICMCVDKINVSSKLSNLDINCISWWRYTCVYRWMYLWNMNRKCKYNLISAAGWSWTTGTMASSDTTHCSGFSVVWNWKCDCVLSLSHTYYDGHQATPGHSPAGGTSALGSGTLAPINNATTCCSSSGSYPRPSTSTLSLHTMKAQISNGRGGCLALVDR
jgi:hypothetical protein